MSKDKPQYNIAVEQISVESGHVKAPYDPNQLLILPTKNLVLFPEVTISVAIHRDTAERTIKYAYDNKLPVGIICQKDPDQESPTLMRGLYRHGVVADVLKIMELPDGEKTAIVHARQPFKVVKRGQSAGMPSGVLVAVIKPEEDILPEDGSQEFNYTLKVIHDVLQRIAPAMADSMVAHLVPAMGSMDNDEELVNTLSTYIPADSETKAQMLGERHLTKRALSLLSILLAKEQEIKITTEIMDRVKGELNEEQKRQFLQHQMEAIHTELYGDIDDAEVLARRAQETALSEQALKVFGKELNKMRRINPQSPDYAVVHMYLETLLDLPWGKENALNTDFSEAKKILDQDHCGLAKVKERVLQQIAVLMHNPTGRAPILCLVGPPGVGKTSLGVSIARALGREYQRVSMGGLHDEAEIRGHRRTYIGAMPGRILDAMKRAGTSNPVLLLDEVDKIGADYKGDPAAALLEVLDPEQNCRFHDNYIDVDFDLSHVLFIATANTLSTVAQPLIDRMEVITLSGYLPEEKAEIARKHLMRRIFAEHKIKEDAYTISDEALNAIIDTYTSESGVRDLEKKLATIARKYLFATLSGEEFPTSIQPEHLKQLLGAAPYFKEKYEGNDFVGVVTGLAWTPVGGEILLAEASLNPGKGTETLTGNLGNVMKESATIAYQWVKANAEKLGIEPEKFEKNNLHVHFPEGAVPKDGPSAGITIATAIVSAFTGRKVRPRIAMTGEMTLRGKVLPVGGIKEKILAAKRAGITDIILSCDNKKDIDDIDAKYVEGLTPHYVTSAIEVMDLALMK